MIGRIRDHKYLWLAAIVMMIIAALGIRPVEAEAAGNGCISRVRTQQSTWQHKSVYASPKVGVGVHMVGHNVYVQANFVYDYCRSTNKGKDRAVKPKFGSFCWFITGDKGVVFDGVKVEPYLYSDERIIWNFDKFKIKDDGSKQHCVSAQIPTLSRQWHKMKHSPRWNMWSQVVRNSGLKDESWENWKGVKQFQPSTDRVIFGWH